jgi:hypothetical protein
MSARERLPDRRPSESFTFETAAQPAPADGGGFAFDDEISFAPEWRG